MRSTANEDLIRLAALGTFPRGEGFWKYCGRRNTAFTPAYILYCYTF